MEYTNSSLVDCEIKSPNNSGRRTHDIDRITPHCVVGQLSAEGIGSCFPQGKEASCNYGIGKDGRVCLIVDEADRSWCSSSEENDQRAVTIECASDVSEPYAMTQDVYNKLIKLCVDICQRNGKTKLLWFADKSESLNYIPKSKEMVLTVHRWFANKSCPGNWLYERLSDVADRVTEELSAGNSLDDSSKIAYQVQCGVYSEKVNAEEQLKRIKNAGFDVFMKKINGMYKIQIGAYNVKENAEIMLEKIKSAGFDAFITMENNLGKEVLPLKTSTEIAKEIFAGVCSDSRWETWGNGQTRVDRLTKAGYDVNSIQKEVNKLFV